MHALMVDHGRTNEFGNKDEKSLGKSIQKPSSDHLIPLLAVLHWTFLSSELLSYTCRPQDWSVGAVCTCCSPYRVCSMTGLKRSDVQGECCILAQISCKEVSPSSCCFIDLNALPISFTCKIPVDSDYENRDYPVLCNIAGLNICLDGTPRFGCCQDIKTLQTAEWVCPFFPCVLGSCKNCAILGVCCVACCNKPTVKNEITEEQALEQSKADAAKKEVYEKSKQNTINLAKSIGNGGRDQVGKTRMRDLKPCLGLCCCMSSTSCKMPNCLGGFCEVLALFLNLSCTCCQPMLERGDTFVGDIFLDLELRLGCVIPRTLASCQCSMPACCVGCCCFDNRCALPCDGTDMPCIINVLGLNLCFKFRPTLACTWYAPLGQFFADYEGKKYSIFDYCRMCIPFCNKEKSDDKVVPDDKVKPDDIIKVAEVVDESNK